MKRQTDKLQVEIDERLNVDFRVQCARKGVSLKKAVAEAVCLWLQSDEANAA